jgi:(1->4)-alpha-D-glucan 1-alpha-D-glucosylmutase
MTEKTSPEFSPRPDRGLRPEGGLRPPLSTYRFQFHRGFGFRDATHLIPYLFQLGVTDLYASPLFAAAPGSTHGYDICDHSRLNPELGTEDDFRLLIKELKDRGMGLILDFVPNHMGAHPSANSWWRDVLENGPSSPYAEFFDIDWAPTKPELKDKILLPILGDQYGQVLERGELRLEYADGTFRLAYFDHNLPINPRPASALLAHNIDDLKTRLSTDHPGLRELMSIQTALWNLPLYTERSPQAVEERAREKKVCRDRLAKLVRDSKPIQIHIETNLSFFNGTVGQPDSFDLLHGLLEAQPYRLAYWRTAMDEINFRRFFDINELAGLRQENDRVFDAVHRPLESLVGDGAVTGIRLDHIDGLHDPAGYLAKLQTRLSALSGGPFYTVVEKITSLGEDLPPWPVAGTTGYDFLNDVNGIFIDPKSALPLKKLYSRFTGRTDSFSQILYQSKYMIMVDSMISELTVLSHALNRVSERDRRSRDFTLESLRRALRELIAAFPLYRTYVGAGGWTENDEKTIDAAIAKTLQRHPTLEPTILKFIRDNLLPAPGGNEIRRRDALTFAMRFQQYTSPVQAKGMEDTSFYRYNLFLSLNEVGGDPRRFGRSLNEFHESNRVRSERHPQGLLSTATHDTKRGEDARARLNVLSEMPGEWRTKVAEWSRMNASLKVPVGGEPAPDRNDEYFFYQTLIGAFPLTETPADDFVERLKAYLTKALREAKTHSSWIHNNDPYETAVHQFAERTLVGPGSKRFLESFLPFQKRVAYHGMWNSLAQVVLKNTSPGVPDLYQGCELWDFNMADPDNRRPVDFPRRQSGLNEMGSLVNGTEKVKPARLKALMDQWTNGDLKLFVTAATLNLRRKFPDLFLHGNYTPLLAGDPWDEHLVAFTRQYQDHRILVAVPRRTVALGLSPTRPPRTPGKTTLSPFPKPGPQLP